MNTRTLLSVASVFVFLGGLMPTMSADAQHRSRSVTSGRTSVRTPSANPNRSVPRPSRSIGGSRSNGRVAPSPGRNLGSGLGGALADSLSRSRDRGLPSGIGNGALLNELGRRYRDGGYGDFRGPGYYNYKAAEEYADAHRDAALANAAVGLVGILVNAAVQERALRSQPVATQPAGHYETRRTLVREGYYETRQVWVPEQVDPSTGEVIEGHHETRRRWVPPVYEETEVFVPASQPRPVTVVRPQPVAVTPAPVAAPLPPPMPMGSTVVHVGR